MRIFYSTIFLSNDNLKPSWLRMVSTILIRQPKMFEASSTNRFQVGLVSGVEVLSFSVGLLKEH
jgi:hypothetical protein